MAYIITVVLGDIQRAEAFGTSCLPTGYQIPGSCNRTHSHNFLTRSHGPAVKGWFFIFSGTCPSRLVSLMLHYNSVQCACVYVASNG